MNSYRIVRPVKWKGKIHKHGYIQATEEEAQPLVLSGALIEEGPVVDNDQEPASLVGVVNPDGTQVDIEDMKVDELMELAKEMEIEGYSNMRKAELVAAIKAEQVQVKA